MYHQNLFAENCVGLKNSPKPKTGLILKTYGYLKNYFSTFISLTRTKETNINLIKVLNDMWLTNIFHIYNILVQMFSQGSLIDFFCGVTG